MRDTYRDPKSDRWNRGIEANYVNKTQDQIGHTLHVGADGFVDGWVDKKGKFHKGELWHNRHCISHRVVYEYDERIGVMRPRVEEGWNVSFRYSTEYWQKLQEGASQA